jgi:hypothetical protein
MTELVPRKRGRPPALGEVTSIRFPPHLDVAIRRMAEREGKSITEWVREVVDLEVARRENRCPTCGHELASDDWDG